MPWLFLLLALWLSGCGSDEPVVVVELEQPNPCDFADQGDGDAMGVFNQTRLGNSMVVNGGLSGGQPPLERSLLLEANLWDLCTELPIGYLGFGPWVFVVDVTPTWDPAAAGLQVNPLKLRFSMGSGGASHILEIDAVGGAGVQVPTAVCRVDVFWDRLPTPNIAGAGAPWVIPTSVVVRGTLHRSSIVPHARRSYLANLRDLVTPTTTVGPIPPFAKDFMVYTLQGGGGYAAGSQITMEQSSPIAVVMTTVTGAQLLAAYIAGGRFPVPPGVDSWEFTYVAPTTDILQVDFGVGF